MSKHYLIFRENNFVTAVGSSQDYGQAREQMRELAIKERGVRFCLYIREGYMFASNDLPPASYTKLP